MKSKGLKMKEKNINLSAPYIGGYNNGLIIDGGCLLGQHDSLTCQFCTMGGAASRPHSPIRVASKELLCQNHPLIQNKKNYCFSSLF